MAKLSERKCTATKHKINRDILLGDGNGLYLVIRSSGAKSWFIDYLFKGHRRKVVIGIYDPIGGDAQSIDGLLDEGVMSLSQARLIAIEWKKSRRAGRDPAEERREAKSEIEAIKQAEIELPTVNDAIKQFFAQHIQGKKSARGVEYRLNRVATLIGTEKISRVTRKDFIAVIDTIALGARGKPAKQMAGEILTTAKRLWRYAETREWVGTSW